MNKRQHRFLLEHVEPALYRLLNPVNIGGIVMLLLALAHVDRPRALLAAFITETTRGYIDGLGLATLFALHGLYLLLRRPRPTAGWFLFASWPLVAYALASWWLRFINDDVSLVITVLAFGMVLYSLSIVLHLARQEDATHDV